MFPVGIADLIDLICFFLKLGAPIETWWWSNVIHHIPHLNCMLKYPPMLRPTSTKHLYVGADPSGISTWPRSKDMTRSLESFLCLSHVFPLLDAHAPNLKWLRGGTRKIHQLDHGGSMIKMLVHMQQCLTMPDHVNFRISSLKNISVAQLVHSESPDNPLFSASRRFLGAEACDSCQWCHGKKKTHQYLDGCETKIHLPSGDLTRRLKIIIVLWVNHL